MKTPPPRLRLAALAVFSLCLAVYWNTLLPGVGGYGDTSKFQFIGKTLGLPHPSGFPTYLFLDALFARLPWGTLAWRINLLSALMGALTAAVLCMLIGRLVKSAAAAAAVSVFFAFTFTFWSTCLIAEVYTLAFFFIAATVYCLVAWRQTMRRGWFYLACLVYAASFGNHLMVIALLPAFIFIVVATDPAIFRSPRALAAVALIVLLGASQYLYLPLRTLQGPSYREGAVHGLKELAWFATGGTFKRHYFSPTIRQVLRVQLPVYGRILANQLTIPGILLALAGFIVIFRRERVWAVFFLLLYAITVALYVNGPHIEQPIYFVPATMALMAPLAFTFLAPSRRGDDRAPRWWRLIVLAGIAALAVERYSTNITVVDLSEKREYEQTADLVLGMVKRGGIILSPNYHWTEALLYKLLGEERRKGDGVCVLHQWKVSELADYARGDAANWDPCAPPPPFAPPRPLYLFALEKDPPSLGRIRAAGWRATAVIENENPLVCELRSISPDYILMVAVKDDGLTILSDEAFDALRAFGLKTRATFGNSFGWAAGDAVWRDRDRWHGIQEFKYSKVSIRYPAGTGIAGMRYDSPVALELVCAGYGRGNTNRILVDDAPLPLPGHGFNIMVFDPRKGSVERSINIPPARLGELRSVFLYELAKP